MGRAAGSCDDDFEAARFRAAGVLRRLDRGAVRGKDVALVRNAKMLERLGRMFHRLPVGR
jgi:hypothetical protein